MAEATEFRLYEIKEKLQRIGEQIIENDGVLTEELEDQLNEWEDAFQDKAENVALFIQTQERMADAAYEEAKRLKKLSKSRQNTADSLKDYLVSQMDMLNRDTVEGDQVKINLQDNSQPSISPKVSKEEGHEKAPEFFERRESVSYRFRYNEAVSAWREGSLPEELFEVDVGKHVRFY